MKLEHRTMEIQNSVMFLHWTSDFVRISSYIRRTYSEIHQKCIYFRSIPSLSLRLAHTLTHSHPCSSINLLTQLYEFSMPSLHGVRFHKELYDIK